MNPITEVTHMAARERIAVGSMTIIPMLEPFQTGGSLTMFGLEVPAGTGMPVPHLHEAYDETIHVHEGALEWTVDGETVLVGAGETLFVPRQAAHAFRNTGAATCRATCVVTPGVLSLDFFREVGATMTPGTPPDPAVIGAIMQRHGLRPVAAG